MSKGRMKQSNLDLLNGTGDAEGTVVNGKQTITRKGTIVTREWKSDDGGTTIVKHDIAKSRSNPISVEYIEPAGTKYVERDEVKIDNSMLPKTKRKYINPANGKEVGYARARNLGLVK